MCMCVQAHVYGHMFKAEYLNVREKGREDHSTFLETVSEREGAPFNCAETFIGSGL